MSVDASRGEGRRARLASARLYLCTPLRPDIARFLDAVLAAGVDIVQLRDKQADHAAISDAAPVFADAAKRHDALFILNDHPELAAAVDADGVHVGQEDPPPEAARAHVGPHRLIGLSTHDIAQVDAAQAADIDYFAIGPVSATPTKPGRAGIGLDPVRHAAQAARHPWFVTGGMAPDTAEPVLAAGAGGLVVVRALTEATDPAAVAAAMARLVRAA